MTSSAVMFQIKLKKITFKQVPTDQQGIMFNLLYNNKKIDNTQPFQVPSNKKIIDLSAIKSLIFNIKDETTKLPIFVYVLYGQISAKKIILKRSDMMKKYQLEQKKQFAYDQDFGVFSINYQVNVKSNQFVNAQLINKNQKPDPKTSNIFPKGEQSPIRPLRRPSMLAVGEKVERIRKSSNDHKQLAESQIKIQGSDNSFTKSQKIDQRQSTIPPLTLVRDDKAEQNLVQKDLKINLFGTFANLSKQNKEPNQKNIHQIEKLPLSSHQNIPQQNHSSHHGHGKHSGHNSLHGSHHNNDQIHKTHENHEEHDQHNNHNEHGSHGSGHGHDDQSGPISLKLKTVMAMLIIGFLFLMYDALDDRFSRRITRKSDDMHDHSQHGHGSDEINHQPIVNKKKKGSKKTKKVSTH